MQIIIKKKQIEFIRKKWRKIMILEAKRKTNKKTLMGKNIIAKTN